MSESEQNTRRWVHMRAGVLAWSLVFISAAIGAFTNSARVPETPTSLQAAAQPTLPSQGVDPGAAELPRR